MIDEIFDRHYQAGRADLNAGLSHLFGNLGKTFDTLHDIQWKAPWIRSTRCSGRRVGSGAAAEAGGRLVMVAQLASSAGSSTGVTPSSCASACR